MSPDELIGAISEASVGLALIQPVCLSYRMSLPNKVFEYVAAGLPVLGSDLPAISAVVNEHRIGLLAEPGDVENVAAKLDEMLKPERNSAFRDAARRGGGHPELGPRGRAPGRRVRRGYGLMDATLERRDSGPARVRPRFSRTFSRSRWPEYERFLRSAQDNGYRVTSLEDWVAEGLPIEDEPTLILRHDVDQHPRSALRMAAIEKKLGLQSSWYFRWRTAHPAVVDSISAGRLPGRSSLRDDVPHRPRARAARGAK